MRLLFYVCADSFGAEVELLDYVGKFDVALGPATASRSSRSFAVAASLTRQNQAPSSTRASLPTHLPAQSKSARPKAAAKRKRTAKSRPGQPRRR